MDFTIVGYIAGFITTASFLPQVVKTFRTRSTHDLSLWWLASFFVGISLWLVYGIGIGSLPVVLANFVTLLLGLVLLALKLKYR